MNFGSTVSIKVTPETLELELADRKGQVHGWTTPSITGVEVIGDQSVDSAVGVFIEHLEEVFWFSDGLLTLVDDGTGTVISLDGVDTEFELQSDGEWKQRSK